MTSTRRLPTGFDARARLREQQRRENEQLSAVLSAETRLAAEQRRYESAVNRAARQLAGKRAFRDAQVVALVEVAGVLRTSTLLGWRQADLTRLRRAHDRDGERTSDRGAKPDTGV
jgi:pantothenate synthetase